MVDGSIVIFEKFQHSTNMSQLNDVLQTGKGFKRESDINKEH